MSLIKLTSLNSPGAFNIPVIPGAPASVNQANARMQYIWVNPDAILYVMDIPRPDDPKVMHGHIGFAVGSGVDVVELASAISAMMDPTKGT